MLLKKRRPPPPAPPTVAERTSQLMAEAKRDASKVVVAQEELRRAEASGATRRASAMKEMSPLERYKVWKAETRPHHRVPPPSAAAGGLHQSWRGPHQIGLLKSSASVPQLTPSKQPPFRGGAAAPTQRPMSAQVSRTPTPPGRRRPQTAAARRTSLRGSSSMMLPPQSPITLAPAPTGDEVQLLRSIAAVAIQSIGYRPWTSKKEATNLRSASLKRQATNRINFINSHQGSAWAEGGDMDYEELEAEAMARGLNDEQCEAAAAYDVRHRKYGIEARKDISALRDRPRRPMELSTRFDWHLLDVRRNRYFLYDEYDPFGDAKNMRKKRAPRFDLLNSVWRPRKFTGNSKDFFETSESLSKMFLIDWNAALASHQLAQLILRTYHPSAQWKLLDMDKAATSAEVELVTNALTTYVRLIYGSLDYYAIGGLGIRQNNNVFDVRFQSFVEFISNVQLADQECPSGRFETCYAIVDARVSGELNVHDRHNKVKALCRHEWLQVLVRCAIEKYTAQDSRGNAYGDVARAVVELFENHMKVYLPIDAMQNSNKFRANVCYNQHIELVMRRHYSSMKVLYERYARMVHHEFNEPKGELQNKKLMSIDEWLLFTEHIGLTDERALHVTVHEVKQIFLWSRIRAFPTYTEQSEIRLRHLFFEDFMEALIRIACIMALPTDEEIAETGAADAGEFLLILAAEQPQSFSRFVEERRSHWTAEPRQAAWRCVDHLLSYIVRVVELNLTGKEEDINDGIITAEEAAMFAEGRLKKTELSTGRSKGFDSEKIATQLASVKQRVKESCRRVQAFELMSDQQIDTLASNMRSAMWKRAEYVFEQGDDGDAFYVIIAGAACVLRDDTSGADEHHLRESDDEVRVLARLGEGDCFGERALLRSEQRFASIMVTSDELHVKMMTRADFEALFADMHEMMKDQYE